LVKGKSPDNFSSEAGSAWFLDLCVHLQLVWESSNFTRSSVPLIESLKSNAHFIIDARKRKNLTHLQSILLFKDSRSTRNRRATQSPAHFQRNPPAAAGWLFFRVARSLRINLDMLVARALKNSQLTCGDVTTICKTVH